MSQKPVIYEFGPFRVDALKRVLLRDGEPIALTSKSFDTLLVLVQHRGDVVSKGDLMNSLWPDTIVEENNLTQQISMLRKVLGEAARDHRYIVTVPGRGYSFVAHVSEVNADESELIVAQHFRSRITVDVEDRPESLPVDVNSVSLLGAINRIPGRITYRTILAVGALAALTLLVLITYPRTENRLVVMENRSIAVLPFKVLNDDPANDYLSTGMADALIAKLSNIKKSPFVQRAQ